MLTRDVRATASGRLAIALALGALAHAVSSAPGFDVPVTPWRAALIALSTGNVVVLWLFARALFDDTFKLRWLHALPWAAVTGISLANCLLLAPAPPEDWRIAGMGQHSIAMSLITLVFIALVVGQTIRSWSADLVESRRRLRIFVVGAAAVYGAVNAVMPLLVFRSSNGSAEMVTVNAALLAGVVAAIACAVTRISGEDLFSIAVIRTTAE